MKNLVQIHTDIFRGSYTNSRSLIFLAEGYREEDYCYLMGIKG